MEKATGDWILLIDADEMVPKSLALILKEIALKNQVDIVEISFRHYIMGEWIRHSGWGYTPLPRFFKRGKIVFCETIHNYMKKTDNAITFRVEPQNENCLFHFNYTDSAHFIEKLNRYTSIEACQFYEQEVRFSYCRLIKAAVLEFYSRFIEMRGYKDGFRGFALSLMMSFYRVLSYIKLWEKYEYKEEPVKEKYDKIKLELLKGLGKKGL